MTTGEVERLL